MFDAFRKCWGLLPSNLRWGVLGIFLLMNLHALAQLAMVGAFLPFLEMVAGSGSGDTGFLSAVRAQLGPMEDSAWLMLFGGCVIAAVFLANVLGAAHGICVARFASAVNAHLSSFLLRSYLLRPYLFYLNHNTSEFLRNIFSEIDFVSDGFLESAMNAMGRILTVAGLGLLLLLVNPWITVAAGFFFAASYTLVYFILRRRLIQAAEERSECDDLRYKAVSEAFGTIKELKVLRRERYFIDAFEEPSRRYFQNLEKVQVYAELPRNVVESIAFAGMVAVALLLLRAHEGVAGALPVLGLFAVAGYRLLPTIKGLYSCLSRMRYYRSSVDTIYRECSRLMVHSEGGVSMCIAEKGTGEAHRLPLESGIQLNDVSFRYPGGSRPAVGQINLTIPVRARVGFCGKSGSGKTTLVDLILGLLQPESGEITVDGVRVDDANRAAWQRNCGYVPQQIYLTDDTIRQNIAFGIPARDVDDGMVRTAARLANIDTFIEAELPDGYETKVGERGVRLSGGQRQRIGIARALYHDPEVIVLDEATSSLDSETERAIMEAVNSLAGRKTILMIAHRLSTIKASDLIVYMENGSVIATGKFEDLVSNNERFHRLAEV